LFAQATQLAERENIPLDQLVTIALAAVADRGADNRPLLTVH